jgi:hypothetical protein
MREGTMGRKKKETGALSYGLKVTEEFGRKLAEVADDFDKYPGALIEEKIGAWVSGEYRRVLKKKLDKADREAREAGRMGG